MKWANKGRTHYCVACDFLLAFLVTLTVAIAIATLIALLVLCLFPRNATAGDIVNFRTATRQAPVSSPVVTILCEISAYNPTVAQTDGNPLITASGQKVRVGGIAADLSVLPLGSRVIIPNYNGGKPCTVIDSGGSIRGNKLDVFMWHESEAIHWGRRRNVRVEVLYIPKVTS